MVPRWVVERASPVYPGFDALYDIAVSRYGASKSCYLEVQRLL